MIAQTLAEKIKRFIIGFFLSIFAFAAELHLDGVGPGRMVAFRLQFAQSLWETDQYHQAMNEWRAVIAQEPGNVEARLALAAGYARMGQRSEAQSEYARILQLSPGRPEALKGLSSPRVM